MEPSVPRPKLTKRQREQVEDFYRQEAADLHRYACWTLGDRVSEAWDLVQTTFHEAIHAWQVVGLYDPDRRRRWLRRVLKNKSFDLRRRPNVMPLTDDVPHPHSRYDDVGHRAELAIALDGCRRVIAAMPPMRQAVASLVWGRSWTTEQVAEHLGVTPSTVRGHLREARRQLRAGISHLMPFLDDEEGQEPAP